MMDLQNFQKYADSYGGDLSRWPREVITAAAETLRTYPSAQDIIDDALSFDHLMMHELDTMPVAAPSADLRARLLALPDKVFILPKALNWLAVPRYAATGLAFCLMLGILTGATDPLSLTNSDAGKTAWILAPDQTTDF